jgi:predicted ATPase
MLQGEGGIGKTRLVRALGDYATRSGIPTAVGSAYPLERDCPYAVFADALSLLVRTLDPGALTMHARGSEAALRRILPMLPPGPPGVRDADEGNSKTQLFGHVTQFLGRLASKHGLLLVLENVHWADPSSLELAHFVSRQVADSRMLLVLSWNDTEPDAPASLRTIERSLAAHPAARRLALAALQPSDVVDLLHLAFGVDEAVAGAFAARLHERTLGNPLFIEQILASLCEIGVLREVYRWKVPRPSEAASARGEGGAVGVPLSEQAMRTTTASAGAMLRFMRVVSCSVEVRPRVPSGTWRQGRPGRRRAPSAA